MITPVDIDDLFELNPDYEIVSFDGEVLIIDNWYKNFDAIQEFLQNTPVARFETDSGVEKDDKNFVDYYDCRLVLTNTALNSKYNATIAEIESLIHKHAPTDVSVRFHNQNALVFNYFKHINPPEDHKSQALPHVDSYGMSVLIYLDKVCSGGTAFYGTVPDETGGTGIRDLTEYRKKFKFVPTRVIEAKPNRMVVIKGRDWHGAFIEDHSKYVDEWRINQVHFLDVINNHNKPTE